MSKGSRYAMIIALLTVVFCSAYLLFVHKQILEIPWKAALIVSMVVGFLFMVGIGIMAPGLSKNPENFVFRFLTLTTIQMLGALSLMAAMIYLKLPFSRIAVFHVIGLFCSLLIVQSLLLIRFNRS